MDKSSFRRHMRKIAPDIGWFVFVYGYHLIYGSIPKGLFLIFLVLVGSQASNWNSIVIFNSGLKENSMLGKIYSVYSLFEPIYLFLPVLLIMNIEEFQNITLTSIVFLPYVIFHTIALANAPLFEVVDEDEESVELQLYPLTLRRIFSLKPFLYLLTFRSRSIKYMSPIFYQLYNFGLIVFYIVAMILPSIGYHFSYMDVVVTLMILISFFINIMRQPSLVSSAKLKEDIRMSS